MVDADRDDGELRRRLRVLREELQAGRIKFVPEVAAGVRQSLAAVRVGHDGAVDLATVDARVRSMALAVTAQRDREELKSSISLAEIQSGYFQWVAASFGELFDLMNERGLDPDAVSRGLSRNPDILASVVKQAPDFLKVAHEFWAHAADAGYAHLADATQLKAIFGGEVFPSSDRNIASMCGIYVDTIVLPEPFLKVAELGSVWAPEEQARYLVKHALTLLQYRELALADVDPPIVMVLPNLYQVDENEWTVLETIAEPDILVHFNTLFGTSVADLEEARRFAARLKDVDSVVEKIARPDRLLFDSEWRGSAADHLKRALRDHGRLHAFGSSVGEAVMMQCVSRMTQANDLLLKTHRVRGTPLIDARTSWQYFRWKLEYDAAHFETSSVTLHTTRALATASETERMAWLGNVPAEALIQLRKDDALPELRAMLSDGVEKLVTVDPSDFQQTTDLVTANMRLAFAEHQQRVRDLVKGKWRFAAKDVGSWLVVGGVELAAAATGVPSYGLAALAAHQILDVPKLKELPKRWRKLVQETNAVKRSPVGLLFTRST